MTVALAALPQFFDNSGDPLSGGLLYTYAAGTLTPLSTYTDRDGLTPNSNPVVLDSAGRADIWLAVNIAYQLILRDSAGNVLDSIDDFYAGADPDQLTTAGIVPASGGTYTGLVNFNGGAIFGGTPAQDLATLDSLNIASAQMRNLCANSDFSVAQRALGSFADGVYGFDQTVNLSQTAATTLSQLAQPTDGIPFAMRITQSNAAAQRIGFCQILEARNCLAYRGSQLVFAPKVRCSVATTIRVALVAWTGSQDAPTRDVVNTWTSTNYTAGNFFVANTSTIAVGAAAVSAAAWTDIAVSSVSPGGVVAPSTMQNLYLVVWSDSTLAQNVTLDASVLRAGKGTEIPLWQPDEASQQLLRCQRYYQVGSGSWEMYGLNGAVGRMTIFLPASMRVAPTVVPSFSYGNCSAGSVDIPSTQSFRTNVIVASTASTSWTASYTASAEL